MTFLVSRRTRLGTLTAATLLVVATVAWLRARPTDLPKPTPTELYSASDPGLVGSTGRPQLVEFYHPA